MAVMTTIPVTGGQHRISAGDYAAVITELGAGLRELHHRGQPVIAGYPADELPPGAAGELLAPWPNRIDGGRYTLAGASYQLDLSEPAHGNAIHGLTRWMPWTATGRSPDTIVLRVTMPGRSGYPFCLEMNAEYQLTADDGLQVTVTARNTGTRPAPYGTGSHPYLTAGTPSVDECVLSLPADRWLPADERGIPAAQDRDVAGTDADFRTARPVGSTRLDHALTGLRPRRRRPRLGPAGRRRHPGRAVGRAGLRLAPGVHRRHPGRRAPAPCPCCRAHDLPAERVRHRHRPAHPGSRRQRDATPGGSR